VYIKDAKGCIISNTQNLTAPGGVTAFPNITKETACGAADGSITITASGVSGSYSYFINGNPNLAGINILYSVI
jgi:hypothetical protein